MKSFEEIAGVWLESEIFGKQYSYRKGIEKDVEHLINYFGERNCEEIKGMDVDKVTSKNISPKAKKYGIIEPTNKVGDLDAVESICRR